MSNLLYAGLAFRYNEPCYKGLTIGYFSRSLAPLNCQCDPILATRDKGRFVYFSLA